MLSKTDDSELVAKYLANRTPDLREQMVVTHIPLVHYILGRMGISRDMGADYEDNVSQGLLGLIDAVDRYDPAYGTQFSSYAVVRIRGKVLDYLRSMDWLTRGARQRTRAVQQAITAFWESEQREPSDEEIAKHLSMDLDKVQQALVDCSRVMVSMDAMTETDDEESGSFHEILADENQADPSDTVDEMETRQRLAQTIRKLSEREQLVLSLYYYEELTFKEIGEVIGVSESRVCQLHARAVINLKTFFAKEDDNDGGAEEEPKTSRTGRPSSRRHYR